MSILENITLQMNLDDRKFEREFKSTTDVVNRQMDALTLGASAFEEKWSDITSNIRSVKRVASGLAISAAIYAVTGAITGASSAILAFRNNLEASKISMEYFAKNASQAKEYIRELEDFAAYTPFNTEGAISMAQYLQAMSVPINSSKAVLKVVSDTAAATGATEENMQRIVTALGQILTKGKLAAEEVRQLANANIPIYDILKEQLKLTGQEIKNLGNLNINASKAVVAILDGLNERYKGASEKIANTLGGMTETIKDDALIISEALFHGTIDRFEVKVTKIRDRLDEWRDIALHFGTGGMITAIIEDLDPEGKLNLEQYVMAAVAGFKNLGETIQDFTTHNGNLLKTFSATAYSGIMSITIAADYLLRAFNTVQRAGESLIDIVNRFTGMSLTLSDVVAGLLVFKTVGSTLYFAGNTALWAGKQFVTLGTSLASMIPMVSSANALTQGLTAGLISLGAAALTAYLGLKAVQAATAISDNSSLVTDEYTKSFEAYNEELEKYRDSLNEDYSSIADNWAAQMSGALDDTEKKAKKTAKKIEKTWLMSFDEVFQIREDPITEGLNDELEKFEDIDWGKFFTLPEFRFPKRLIEELEEPTYSLTDAINTAQEEVSILNGFMPALILSTSTIRAAIKNRKNFLDELRKNTPNDPDGGAPDDVLNDRELKAKLDERYKQNAANNRDLVNAIKEYDSIIKDTNTIVSKINDVDKKISTTNSQIHALQFDKATDSTAKQISELQATVKSLQTERASLVAQLPLETRRIQAEEIIAADIHEIKDGLKVISKNQARLGTYTDVNRSGLEAATGFEDAVKLNNILSASYTKLVDISDAAEQHSDSLQRLIKKPDDQLLINAANAAGLRLDTLHDALSSDLAKISDKITKIQSTRSLNSISTDKFYGMIETFGTLTKNELANLGHIISMNNPKEIIEIVKTLPADTDRLLKYMEQYVALVDAFKLPVDRELLGAQEKAAQAIAEYGREFKKYATAYNKWSVQQYAYSNGGRVINTHIEEAESALKEAAQNLINYQEAVRLMQPEVRKSMTLLEELKGVTNNIHGNKSTIGNEYVSNVYSLVREIEKTITGDTVFSTQNPALLRFFERAHKDIIKKLDTIGPGITKTLSIELLNDIKPYIYGDDVDRLMPSTKTSAEYKAEVQRLVAELDKSNIQRGREIISELYKLRLPTDKRNELERAESAFETTAKESLNTKIVDNIYTLEVSKAKSLDIIGEEVRQYLNRPKSPAEIQVYKNIQDIIESATDINKQLYNRLTQAAIHSDNAQKLLNKRGITYKSDIDEIFERSGIAKYFAENAETEGVNNSFHAQLERATQVVMQKSDVNRLIADIKTRGAKLEDIIAKLADELRSLGIPNNDVLNELAQIAQGDHPTFNLEKIIADLNASNDVKNAVGSIEAFQANLKSGAYGTQISEDAARVLARPWNTTKLEELQQHILNLADKQLELAAVVKKFYDQSMLKTKDLTLKIDAASVQKLATEYRDILNERLQLFTDEITKNDIKTSFEKLEEMYAKSSTNGTANTVDFKALTGADIESKVATESAYIYQDLYRKLGILSSPSSAALANLRLGLFEGSITEQGTTAQSAIQHMLMGGLSDEIAVSTNQLIQRGMGEAFNTRLRSVLDDIFKGAVYQGATGADVTGQLGVKLSDIVQVGKKTYGLVQRILISDKANKAILNKITTSQKRTTQGIEFIKLDLDAFVKEYKAIAPDVVSKVVSDIVGAPKLKGMVLSFFDASVSAFDPIRDAVNVAKQSLVGTPEEQIERIKNVVADKMLTGPTNDAYSKNMYNLLITYSKEQREAYTAMYKEQAQLIKDAVNVLTIARLNKIDIPLDTTTLLGTTATTATRYSTIDVRDISDAGELFKEALDSNAEKTPEMVEAIETLQKRLSTFSRYVRNITDYSIKKGELISLRNELAGFKEQLQLGQLMPTRTTGIPGDTEGTIYNFALSTLSDDMKKALSTTLDDAEKLIDKVVPATLVTYNDVSSRIIRTINAAIDSGKDIQVQLNMLDTDFQILIKAAEKLEHAYGLDNTISKMWQGLRTNWNFDMLKVADPFRYLNLEETVGKMVADLTAKTNSLPKLTTITNKGLLTELTQQDTNPLNLTEELSDLDIKRLKELKKNYRDTIKDAAKTSQPVVGSGVKVPVIGLSEQAALNSTLDSEAVNAALKILMSQAADKSGQSSAKEAIDAASKGTASAGPALPDNKQTVFIVKIKDAIDDVFDDWTFNDWTLNEWKNEVEATSLRYLARQNAAAEAWEAARKAAEPEAFTQDIDELIKEVKEAYSARTGKPDAFTQDIDELIKEVKEAYASHVNYDKVATDSFESFKNSDEFSEFFKDFGKNLDDTYIDPTIKARQYMDSITKSSGLTNNKWANLALAGDTDALDALRPTMSTEEAMKFTDAFKDFYKDWDDNALNAALRGDSFGEFATADEFGKAFEEHLKEAFGDSFDDFEEKVFAANNETLTKGPLAARAYADFANALQNNSFVNKMLMPNDLGLTGIDYAAALQRSVEALSTGAEETMAAQQRWQDINSKYAIQGLDRKGEVDTNGNAVDLLDAAEVGGWSLLIEGALTSILSSAITGAVAGSTTAPGVGTVAGTIAGLVAATAASVGMALTGSFDYSNIASEEIKEMLNNTDFAYSQAKQQGASDKEAREMQNKIARDLYLQYYNDMSSFWSMYDKADIKALSGSRHATNEYGTGASVVAFREAIAELTGNKTNLHRYTPNEDSNIQYLADEAGNIQAVAYDIEKVYQQLYTLYTTGGMQNIEDYNNKSWFGKLKSGFDGTGLTTLESDWMWNLKDVDKLTKARMDDLFKLEIDAAEYIKTHGEEQVKSLLAAYDISANNMQQMIEGIINLYNRSVEMFNQTIEAKAAYINAGTVGTVDLDAISAGTGTVSRLLQGDLSGVDTQYLDALADATGIYINAMSDTLYSLTADIADVRDKMTGFTVTFPDTIKVGSDTIEVKSILSDTDAVEILNGMGININADGTVTISTEAVNSNESGHERSIAYSLSDVSAYELAELAKRGINLSELTEDKINVTLTEDAMLSAVKGLTYNLSGVNITDVSEATAELLKAAGILLSQDSETGKSVATVTDEGFITGSRTLSDLLASLDPSVTERLAPALKDALAGLDAINAFGAAHGESRIGSAAGAVVDTGFTSKDYSTALEQAFANAGITLQAATDAEGKETVYAAINNVGEQWHKAITQWKTSDVKPEMMAFLDALGAEVYKSGDYTMVSTEGILDKLANTSTSRLTEILFDNSELWSQFPDETKQAFIDAGLATEDGFITLTGEVLDGWHRYQVDGQTALAMAFSAMNADTYAAFANLQGTTIKSYDALTNENKYWLSQLGITSEEEYNKNADSLVQLATNKMGLLNDGVMLKWSELSASQLVQLFELGITSEEQYNANMDMLKMASENGMDILYEDTVLSWDQLSATTIEKLNKMGIKTEDDYKAYLATMDVKTGEGFSTIDDTTEKKLADLGVTTSSGWGSIKQVTDTTLSETEHLALGHMKFEDLPEAVQQALGEQGVRGDLKDAWFYMNQDADSALGQFSDTVDGMAADLDRVRDLATKLKQALADPGLQAETLNANLAATAATALEAAKSSSNKWAEKGVGTYGRSYSYGRSDSDEWANWSNNTSITSQLVAINEDKLDAAGNPMVYYIYNLDVNGQPGQIIKNSNGVWRKYLGTLDYNADNVPAFKLGGMVTGDGLFRAGEFGLNEAIVPLEQPQAMHKIGSALAAAIPAYELVAPLATMLGTRDGGVAQFSSFRREEPEASIDGIVEKILAAQAHNAPQPSYMSNSDDKRPLYVGTLIADKAGLRELNRQLKRVERQNGGI
jgi:tape measure domain-containing protein